MFGDDPKVCCQGTPSWHELHLSLAHMNFVYTFLEAAGSRSWPSGNISSGSAKWYTWLFIYFNDWWCCLVVRYTRYLWMKTYGSSSLIADVLFKKAFLPLTVNVLYISTPIENERTIQKRENEEQEQTNSAVKGLILDRDQWRKYSIMVFCWKSNPRLWDIGQTVYRLSHEDRCLLHRKCSLY